MKAHPDQIELDEEELRARLSRMEAVLGSEFAEPFRQLLDGYVALLGLLRDKKISIQRLRKLLFGGSSERSSKIMPEEESSSEPATDAGEDSAPTAGNEVAPAAENQPAQEEGNRDSHAMGASSHATDHDNSQSKRRPGHGRNGADAYTGCDQVIITHGSLKPGDPCPDCGQGTVYRQSQWSPLVRLKGRAPVGGTVYRLERLRCHLCGSVHTAELPKEAGPEKYDPTVSSIIATLRYGEGLPWNRIQRIQKAAGVPLPASTQWGLVRDSIPGGVQAAYDQLLVVGAEGEIVYNDDTRMQVLSLTEKLKRKESLLEEDPDRRGVFTTSVLSRAEGRPPIALFFTGPHHAGENLRKVLVNRPDELPSPIQMCDGLSRNIPKDFRVILANCLTHSRRKFVDVIDAFPSEVKYVVKCLKKVYQTDGEARKQQLSPLERLSLHQERSGPVMEELHQWLQQQLDQRKVEPNSSLGGAISYMLNRWDELTLFLRVPGAPLDNNLCEQLLKMAIRHRRNSLFYKTMQGAAVGDLYMTLIHTCYLCGADPFHYLTELQRNGDRVTAAPGDWLPWNYRKQLGTKAVDSESSRPPPVGPAISTPQ